MSAMGPKPEELLLSICCPLFPGQSGHAFVDLQLPESASIYATKGAVARLDKLLKDDQDVDHWTTYVGQGAVRFYLPLNVQLPTTSSPRPWSSARDLSSASA